jgi:hypothetical protein
MKKAATYAEAQRLLQQLKRAKSEEIVTWDAGEGWTAEAYYCNWRRRIVAVSINPEGMRIV